jgi:hypothetical protein
MLRIFHPKIPTASAGFESANLVEKACCLKLPGIHGVVLQETYVCVSKSVEASSLGPSGVPKTNEFLANIVVNKIRDKKATDSIMTHRICFVSLKGRRDYNIKQGFNINVSAQSSVG